MAWMLLHPETQDCTQLFQVHFIIKSFDQTGLLNLGDLPRGVKLVTCRLGLVLRVGDLTGFCNILGT